MRQLLSLHESSNDCCIRKKSIITQLSSWCLTSSFQRCAVAVGAAISHGKTQWAIFYRRTALSLGHDSHELLPNSKESVCCAEPIIRRRREASPTSPFEGFLPPSLSADLLSEHYVPGVNCSPLHWCSRQQRGLSAPHLKLPFHPSQQWPLVWVNQNDLFKRLPFFLEEFPFLLVVRTICQTFIHMWVHVK